MRRYQPLVALLIPALALFLAAPGCSKKEEPKKDGGGKPDAAQDGGGKKDKDNGGEGEMSELASTGWGTLKGIVTYDGTPRKPDPLPIPKTHKDAQGCHDAKDPKELLDQTWMVSDKGGVANVVIFLKAPEGKFFKIKDEDKKPKEDVKLHQPHCAFLPHVFVHFPAYYDKKGELQRTGQKIHILNDAKFNHNTAWAGDPNRIKGGNQTLQPNQSLDIKDLVPDPDTPISFKCNIHEWMSAKCWSLDHPYAAVTDKDGKFEIRNVPAGAKLYVVAWHESPGFFYGGKQGTETQFEDGKTKELDLKVKAK